jgi:hypothetical protein
MRMYAAAALVGIVLVAAPATQSRGPATSLERQFAAGGRISMALSAGEYEITGSPDGRIRLDWDVDDSRRLDEVDNWIAVKGTEARITTDGPQSRFDVRIQVPSRSNLHVRLTAGELAIKGVEGDKDVELHAGELDIDVVSPEDYRNVDAAIWAGEIHAAPFRVTKEGLFRSFDWRGNGRYRLHAHLKAGELRLHSTAPSDAAKR